MSARSPAYPSAAIAATAWTGPGEGAVSGVWSRKIAIVLLLLGVTFLQRLCFPLGTFQISIAVPLAYVGLYILLTSGQLRINTIGFVLYATAIAGMIATLYFGKASFSPFSFFYLVVLYLAYVFSMDVPRAEYLGYLRLYQKFLIVLAGIAFLQFGEQLTTGTTFSLFDFLPDDFVLQNYNTRPTLAYGSAFHKSNAEFFLEPSFLSQYMAIGIIIELLYFGNWRRMLIFGAAIFVSFSGTGMVLLALFALASVVKAKRFEMLFALPVLLMLYLIFQDNSYVTAITGRVDEFDAQGSSAFIRFIGPNEALSAVIVPDFLAFLVGKGPGVADQLSKLYGYQSNFPVMHKVLIEYGMVGFLPFMGFVIWRFFGAPRSRLLAAALFIMYLFLSGSLLQPHTIFLFYLLAIMMPRQAGESA